MQLNGPVLSTCSMRKLLTQKRTDWVKWRMQYLDTCWMKKRDKPCICSLFESAVVHLCVISNHFDREFQSPQTYLVLIQQILLSGSTNLRSMREIREKNANFSTGKSYFFALTWSFKSKKEVQWMNEMAYLVENFPRFQNIYLLWQKECVITEIHWEYW